MTSQALPADEPIVSDDAVVPLEPVPGPAGDPVIEPTSRAVEMGGRDSALPTPADPEADPAAMQPMPGEVEVGGRDGPEPTRYGDWELRGRCIDF